MYSHSVTLVLLLATLASILAAPNQTVSLAGREHGSRRANIGRRGHGSGRACKARVSQSVSATVASSLGIDAQVTGGSASELASAATFSAMDATSAVTSSAPAETAAASQESSVMDSASPVSLIGVSTSTGSATAPSASASSGNATVSGKAALTPNGIKAGMTLCTGLDDFAGKLGWCYDWSPSPSPPSGMAGVSMLWGDGSSSDSEDASRFAAFKALSTSPEYIMGFEEPDCSTTGSASMSVADSATTWNELIAPYGAKGSLLISPSMCKQADEVFLTPFKAAITTDWDVTNLHINKMDMAGVKKDLDHYWNTYSKPMWVTEFACVDDTTWTPCTDQTVINQYINDIVKLFEEDSRVYAYAYSNGVGLGDVWPAFSSGQLTTSGQTYLSAISQYH